MHQPSRLEISPSGKILTHNPTPSLGFKSASSPEENKELLLQGHDLSSKKLLVLYSAKHNNVLHDPMTGKPVSSRFKNYLEPIAKEYKCEILSVKEAFARILKRGASSIDPNTTV